MYIQDSFILALVIIPKNGVKVSQKVDSYVYF